MRSPYLFLPSLLAVAFAGPLAADTPAQAPERDPGKPDEFFGPTKVWTFHLKLTAEAWQQMQPTRTPTFGMGFGGKPQLPGGKPLPPKGKPQPPARKPEKAPDGDTHLSVFGYDFTWAQGTLEFGKEVYKDVGVRFKGNSTYLFSARGIKRPLKIDFDRFVKGQKLHGLTMVALGNNAFDPSQLRETLSYDIYRTAGVPAPRTAFVKLYLTVEGKHQRAYAGLYTLIETVNKGFLRRHFGDGSGLLLKPEQAPNLAYLGERWPAYERAYRPKGTPTPETQRRLIAFTRLVHRASDANFRKEIGSLLDVEGFLRYLAASTLMVNLDSFQGLGHNYYLYLDPKTNRFAFIPWDLNMSFAGLAFGGTPDQLIELSVKKPHFGQNRLIDRLLAVDEFNNAYRGHLEKLTREGFRPGKLHADIDAMTRATREAVALEKKKGPKGMGGFGGPMMLFGRVPDLKPFVTKRVESVAQQLEGKSEGFAPRFTPFGGFGGPGGKPAPGGKPPEGGKPFPGGKPLPGGFPAPATGEPADGNGDARVGAGEGADTAARLRRWSLTALAGKEGDLERR
jgi:hypothetical protein